MGLGMGIHGEPGIDEIDLPAVTTVRRAEPTAADPAADSDRQA